MGGGAVPKSAILILPLLDMSRFSGLISRWMMSRECMYSSPFIRSVKYLRACDSVHGQSMDVNRKSMDVRRQSMDVKKQ